MQCDYFDAGRCRSCTLMGTPYAVQLAAKQDRVASALAEVAAEVRWLEPARSAASHYRNKAKLVVGGHRGSPTLGILDERGRGVDLRRCGLYEPGLAASFDTLHRFVADLGLEPYDVPARRGELKYLIVTHSPDGEQLLRFVLRSDRHLPDLKAALPSLLAALPSLRVVTANLHPEHKAVLEGETEVPLTSQTLLAVRVGDVTLMLAPDRIVVGVETSAEAVDAARAAAACHSDGEGPASTGSVTFEVGDATTAAPSPPPDLVVVNPLRRGIGPGLAGWLDVSAAERVLYSSCNLGSLARDLAAMPSLRTVEGRVFDMFPQTPHTEVMVRLERR